jgi:inner membrane protein
MDPLTHATLGIAVALAVAPRGASLPSIALAGFAAGTLPDIDIFLHSETDPLFSLEYHRHFTHSILFSPFIALIGTALALLALLCFGKHSPYRPILFPAWLAALSHLFCDLWTSYGTRIAWPFNNVRYSLDWISVIDPLFTLPVLALTLIALVKARPRPARFALTYATIYLALCFVQHERATHALESWLKTSGPGTADRLAVHPSFGNILVWRALVEKDRVAHNVAIRCGLGAPTILPGQSTPVFNHPDQAITELKIDPTSPQARDVRRFFHFSNNWVAQLPNEPQTLGDLRYSALPDSLTPLWGMQILPPDTIPPIKWREFNKIETRNWDRFRSLITGEAFSAK